MFYPLERHQVCSMLQSGVLKLKLPEGNDIDRLPPPPQILSPLRIYWTGRLKA
jgi:hypothetical protein